MNSTLVIGSESEFHGGCHPDPMWLLEQQLLLGTLVREALGDHTGLAGSSRPLANPLRAYLHLDDATLRPLARRAGSSRAVRWLWLRRSPEAIGYDAPRIYAAELFGSQLLSAPVADAVLAGVSIEDAALNHLAPLLALVPLGVAAGDPGATSASAIIAKAADPMDPRTHAAIIGAAGVRAGTELLQFETWGAKLVDAGPLVSADVMRAYYRSQLFSALSRSFHLELEQYGRPARARTLYDALQAGAEPASKDLHTWLGTLVQVAEKGTSPNLLPGLSAFPTLGGHARVQLFTAKKQRSDWGDTELAHAARLLASSLDARPSHRGSLAIVAHGAMDLTESDRLLESAVSVAPFASPSIDAWKVSKTHDLDAIRRASTDARFSAPRRAKLLASGLNLASEDPAMRAAIGPLLLELPKSAEIRRALAAALVQGGHSVEARALVEPWLAKYADDTLDTVAMRVIAARSFEREGRFDDARKAIGDAAKSYQFDAMHRTALIEAELGHSEESELWAKRVVERYPGSSAGAALALTRFLAGNDAGAAAAIAQHRVSYTDSRWKIARELAPVLAKASPARIDSALAAIARGIDHVHVRGFAAELNHAKRPDLALRLLGSKSAPGIAQLEIEMDAYKLKQTMDGEAAALAWLETRVPAAQREPLSMFAFAADAPEVLWKLVPEKPGHSRDNEFTWLMRAAAVVAHGREQNPHYAAIVAYFKDAVPTHYAQLGKYLLGLADEASDEPFIKDASDACEGAFYIAHKANAEKRFDEAAAFYRVTIEAGTIQEGEYRWAYDRLYAMREGGDARKRAALGK